MARSDPDWPARSLLFLAQALPTLQLEDAELCLRYVVHLSFVKLVPLAEESTYRRLLERNPDDGDGHVIAPTPPTIAALLEVARVILDKYTREQTHALDEFPAWIGLLLEFVFDAVPRVRNLHDVAFYKPLTGPSDGPGLRQLLSGLIAKPHTTRALLHFFAAHSRLLPSSSSRPDQSFFLYWIRGLPWPTDDAAVAVLNTCAAFFESHSFFDSPAVLLPLCFLILYYHTHSDAGVDACWRRLFAAVPACYNRILNESDNKSLFSIGKLACNHSASDDPHTETCETAFNILYRCDFIGHHLNLPNEMIAFLRKFMCGSHNGYKSRWFPRLDSTKNTQAEVTALERSHDSSSDEQNTVSPDAKRSQVIGSDSTPTTPTPADSPDDQLDDGRHASACEDAVSSGPPATEDPAPGDAAMPLRAPIQDLAGSGSGGHDGGCAAEGLRCPDFAQTADAKPRDLAGTTAIEFSAPEARSMRLEENSASEPLGSAESVPVSVLPGSTLVVDSPPSPDTLPTDPRTNPAAMTAEHLPSPPPPALPVPAPLSDNREAPGRDPPNASGERGTAIPPDSLTVASSGHDDASASMDAVERVNSVGDVAGPSKPPLVALESPEIPSSPTDVPETRCSADVENEMDDDGGDLSVLHATWGMWHE